MAAKVIEEGPYLRKIPEPGDWVHIEGEVAVPMDDDGKPDRKSAEYIAGPFITCPLIKTMNCHTVPALVTGSPKAR